MSRQSVRTLLIGALALAAAGSARAQTPLTDNRDGYFVNFEEPPIRPMALAPNGLRIWAVNPADASVTVIQKNTMAVMGVVPVGLGPVSVARRPGTGEMWIVCHVSNSIVIVEALSFRIIESIAVGHEPCGLVFSSDGNTAYVSISQDNTIEVIDAAARTIAATIEFGSNDVLQPASSPADPVLNAEEPRALVLDGETLYALSFESGNGTLAFGAALADAWSAYDPNGTFFLPPPDRDVFSFDVTSSGTFGSVALWRMGSLNFDMKLRPGSVGPDLYVSNVDYNNTLIGEHQFPVHGVARHRVSYAAPISASDPIPQPTTHIDLNVDQHAGLGGESRFATPNEMAFDAEGETLYVACYETKNAAVIDTATDTVIAELQCGAGPRGVLLDEAGGKLYVYNRADLTISSFALPIPAGTVVAPLATFSAGYDPTPLAVRNGRKHAIDASNSSNGLQSCNTCHMDGAKDGIGWDLGSFTGSLSSHPPIAKDAKGIKVTQSLRGIEETPPFHWRGDRSDLKAFNPAFEGLLGGSALSDAEFADFQAYVFHLSYGPNPAQPLERDYSALALEGLGIFTNEDAGEVPHDSLGNLVQLSCNDCHSMNGFSGTVNQIVVDNGSFLEEDASQLRGLFDKASDQVDYSAYAAPPASQPPINQKFPATGWGFLNSGVVDTVREFVFDLFSPMFLNAIEKDRIVRFLNEFDSGTAPAVGSSWTLTQAKSGSPATSPVSTLLMPQATAGHIDLVARGWIDVGSGPIGISMLFRPHPTAPAFETSSSSVGPFTYADLDNLAAAGDAVLLFFGDSVKSGYRRALDRDMDGAKNLDEVVAGTPTGNPDSDNDGFPDGHELAHGSDPLNGSSHPVDTISPVISNVEVSWKNSNVAKLRWTTSEPATSRVTVDSVPGGPIPYSATFTESQFKTEHVIVVRGMNPGQDYTMSIKAEDPGQNVTTHVLSNPVAMQPHLFDSVHSKSVNLGVTSVNPFTGQVMLRATVTVVDQDGIAEAGSTVSGRFVEWVPGNAPIVTPFGPTLPTGATGKAIASYGPTNVLGSGAIVEVIVDSIDDDTKIHFHPLEVIFSAQFTL